MHVVVVGAGVIGLCIADELARRGVRVSIFDSREPGSQTSAAAAGILGAQLESLHAHSSAQHTPSQFSQEQARFAQFVAARARWAVTAERFRDAGLDVGYARGGALEVALSEERADALRRAYAFQQDRGSHCEWVNCPSDADPAITPSARGALSFPDEAQIEPAKLLTALVALLGATPRVRVRAGCAVAGLLREGGRVVGVHLGEEKIASDAVVLATGIALGRFAEAPTEVGALRPIRGQMLEFRLQAQDVPRVIASEGVYLVYRGDGRIVCGSTMEDVGYRDVVDRDAQERLLRAAVVLVPGLAHAEVIRRWCGLRPFLPGQTEDLRDCAAPFVGATATPGLFVAAGHHRNGILLCLHSAAAVADAVLA